MKNIIFKGHFLKKKKYIQGISEISDSSITCSLHTRACHMPPTHCSNSDAGYTETRTFLDLPSQSLRSRTSFTPLSRVVRRENKQRLLKASAASPQKALCLSLPGLQGALAFLTGR